MKYILSIIFCILTFFAKAQSIDKLIAQTEEYLTVYNTLSSWAKPYTIKDFNFTKQELKDVSVKNDTIDNFDVIIIFQGRILENIDKIAHHKDFPKKGSDFFVSSPDKKLFNFVLDEKTGGSYRSRLSCIYYLENNKIIYKECGYSDTLIVNGIKVVERNFDLTSLFNRDGYYSIDTIQTNSGVKYLLQGDVIYCNTCLDRYITLVKFENGSPVSEFSYELSSRFGYVEQFDYDAVTKTITIAFETDDLTGRESDYDTYDEYCKSVFTFDGETFELTESYWKKTKKDSQDR